MSIVGIMGTRKKASLQWQLAPVEAVTLPSGLQYCFQKTMAAGDLLIVENVLMPTRIKNELLIAALILAWWLPLETVIPTNGH